MNEEIILINVSDIASHPKQEEIYGEMSLEPEFIASVKDDGILNPIIVTYSNLFGGISDCKYTSISGHRRLAACRELNIEQIPAIIREYNSVEDSVKSLLALNFQREKNDTQRINEFLAYKQILCQIGKKRMSKGVYADTIFDNDEVLTLVKTLKIDPQQPLNSTEILKNICGFAKREQQYMTVIFDADYQPRTIEKLTKLGLSLEDHNALLSFWNDIRTEVTSKRQTLKKAHDAIKSAIDNYAAKLEEQTKKPAKKATPDKQKPKVAAEVPKQAKFVYLSGPISNNNKYVDDFAKAEKAVKDLFPSNYKVINPAKFSIDKTGDEHVDWIKYMAEEAIPQLLSEACDAIAMLKGWENSKGASVEHAIAKAMDYTIVYLT